jgi:hypothetical protein
MTTEKETKEDELVSFIDDESETVVDLSPEKKESKSDNTNDRLAAAEAETARLRAQIEADRAAAYGNNRQQYVPDSFDQELDAINEREKALGVQWELDKAAGRLKDKNLVDEYDKKAREIQDQKSQISTRRALRDMLPQITAEQQRTQLRQQYSDVYNNPSAITYAEGAYKMLLASGEQDGPQLLDKAMNQARIQFKMPGANYMKPSQSDKDKLTGIPGGGGRNSNSDSRVKMGKAEKQMAVALYIDAAGGDEKKAWAMWAKGPGSKAKKEIAKSQRG